MIWIYFCKKTILELFSLALYYKVSIYYVCKSKSLSVVIECECMLTECTIDNTTMTCWCHSLIIK